MTPTRDEQIRAVYRAALERPVAERSSFIATLAGSDDDLRRSVERLLSQQGTTDARSIEPAPRETPAGELPAGTVIAHYRIEGVLGRGGMGVVYRATDTKLKRAVAIKFLSIAVTDAQAKRRFQQEAETASALNHPHIVTVHDVGEHDGHQYIVSELIDGGTLDDWSIATRRRTWRQSVELLTGVADGIAAAHAAGVLHRDIKPGNILVGSNGYAKIADFGLAKLVDPQAGDAQNIVARQTQHTRAGVVIGTVAYMSPEQASALPLDARSDVFSFGIVLYQVLAGRVPFEAANDLEVLKRIVHAVPPPLPDDVPDLLRMSVEKALEKDPADRYQMMRDLVADLRRVTRRSASSQAGTSAVSDTHAIGMLVKRYRRGVLAGGAALVVAVAGAIYLARLGTTGSTPSRDYEMTQLTTTGNAVTPAITPDGQYVVYAQQDGGGVPRSLWLRRVATASNVPIVQAEPDLIVAAPTVAPDNEHVDFLRARSFAVAPELWRVPFLGGTPRLVAEDVWSPLGWSPDGRRMAFVRADSTRRTTSLVVADADGGNQRVVASRTLPAYFLNINLLSNPALRPAWSPDGEQIAAMANEEGPRVVFVDANTSRETRILDSRGALSPQGIAWLGPATLVLTQPRELLQRVQIFRMSYPGGAVLALTNDLSSYFGLDVDAARSSLVTARRETQQAVWVGDAAGGNGRQIVPPFPAFSVAPTFAWAGDRVVYATSSSGRVTIASIDSEGESPRELAVGGLGVTATADGSTIVFARDNGGLWKIDSSGRHPVQLVPGSVLWPVISPDGNSVVFDSSAKGTQSPWIVPIDGGEPTQIVDAFSAGASLDVSADGRLLFASNEEDGTGRIFVVCELPTCSNRVDITAPPDSRRVIRWTPDGEIAYVDALGSNIWSMPVDSSAKRQITSFEHTAPLIGNFDWSSDGKRLAIVHLYVKDDIVLLRGLQP